MESISDAQTDQVLSHMLLSPTVARADLTREAFLEEGPVRSERHREGDNYRACAQVKRHPLGAKTLERA